MSFTPSDTRKTNPSWGVKLTPSHSPFLKNYSSRSPTKPNRTDLQLSLKQIIGTTTSSPNGFDSLPSARWFAFVAGAAAVLARVGDDLKVSQRFFRARPAVNSLNTATPICGPATPNTSSSEARTRTAAATLRDAGLGVHSHSSTTQDGSDSPGGKSWTARERVKAATAVSLSPDGKYLAVGETGYRPRVLIFSTSDDAPEDTPLTCLYEHTFGVRAVAFSPDSQYLASLGSANDGFLYIWSVNARNGAATLHLSNKCTSNIHHVAWIGSSIVTVGTRHVKIWRTEDRENAHLPSGSKWKTGDASLGPAGPMHRTLAGRNCLLGDLLDADFTSIVAVTPCKAIICSSRGDVCLLDDTDRSQRFHKVANVGFGVTALAKDSRDRLHVAGSNDARLTLKITDLVDIPRNLPHSPPMPASDGHAQLNGGADVVAMGLLDSCMATVDSRRIIRLFGFNSEGKLKLEAKLPAHGDAVLGVRALRHPNTSKASFITWCANGLVLLWAYDGTCMGEVNIELEQDPSDGEDTKNELRVVEASAAVSFIASGDRHGFLRTTTLTSGEAFFTCKAHVGEITDIAMHEGEHVGYIASSGRDRMVQVFYRNGSSWVLLQTLDEHVGAVTALLFLSAGRRLLSSSSDRTVVVRESASRIENGKTLTAFLIVRTITLKATPISITPASEQEDTFLVSTIDRNVHKIRVQSGHIVLSFKASDSENGDAVVMSSLLYIPAVKGPALIAGVSSTDKSIRLYEENGYLVGRDWGHTEGVTDIALVGSDNGDDSVPAAASKSLVTAAVDGTIFVWNMEARLSQRQEMSRSLDSIGLSFSNGDTLGSKPPLRRVLSQSEIARFQQSPTEEVSSPTGARTPRLGTVPSRLSMANAPKLDPSPLPRPRTNFQTPGFARVDSSTRMAPRTRSPSPPSPRNKKLAAIRRPSLVDTRSRTRSAGNMRESGSGYSASSGLVSSTEQVCRTLRTYRKKLATSAVPLNLEAQKELERELGLTARAVGERAVKAARAVDESLVVRLLDQYSERLVERLDEKIAASVAMQVGQKSGDPRAEEPSTQALQLHSC